MRRRDVFAFSALKEVAKRDRLSRPLNRVLNPFNPFNPQRYTDPYPLYDELREAGPLYFHRIMQTWLVTGYEEAEVVLRGPVSVDRSALIGSIAPYRHLRSENRDLILSTILMRDPPGHTRLRKLVNRAFTPRAVSELTPRVQEIADELLAEMHLGTTVDVMDKFASRLPIYAIGELLGVDRNDRRMLKAMSDVVAQFVDPITGFDVVEMDRAIELFRVMFDDLADQRTKHPRNDLISALVTAEVEGERLSRDELIGMAVLLLIAGHETTSNLIGNALIALQHHPQARAMLLDRPDLAENAVEELLRYDTPVQATDRTVLEDITIGDQTLRRGASVLLLLGGANRDPRRYQQPNLLQLDRLDPKPISFGHGLHHCVGAALARLEVAVAIPSFLQRFPTHQLVTTKPEWKRSVLLRGPTRLPVSL